MEKQRKRKILCIAALVVAVLGLTVAFAALSETLTINGTASVEASTWDIHLENLSYEEYIYENNTIITDGLVNQEPIIQGNQINNVDITFTKPGQSVTYTFDIRNSGTIDAKITGQIMGGVNIEIIGPDEHGDYTYVYEGGSEEAAVQKMLENMFPIADWDGDGETTLEERVKTAEIMKIDFTEVEHGTSGNGYNLPAGARSTYELSISYPLEATELPKGEVVLNLEFGFTFSQK